MVKKKSKPFVKTTPTGVKSNRGLPKKTESHGVESYGIQQVVTDHGDAPLGSARRSISDSLLGKGIDDKLTTKYKKIEKHTQQEKPESITPADFYGPPDTPVHMDSTTTESTAAVPRGDNLELDPKASWRLQVEDARLKAAREVEGIKLLAGPGDAATKIAVAALDAASKPTSQTQYREPYSAIPVTTPEVNPFVVPHPDESFIAYGAKHLEQANTDSFTAFGSDQIMDSIYQPKQGVIEQIGTTAVSEGSSHGMSGVIGAAGEREIQDFTQVMPNTERTAGSQLSATGKQFLGSKTPGNAIVELGERHQAESISKNFKVTDLGGGVNNDLIKAPPTSLYDFGKKEMANHDNLCFNCKKKY